ncbi:MAG: beta-ketoacyl synthase N-terminal-like domain-containing protein [Nonlabens sp.]|uniref:beta-ketoacyl synthase N-terminal-like domain-containing protein n=1 Tax=Nonlabens sp. TaxID=1888209 RepID=UPI003EF1CC08
MRNPIYINDSAIIAGVDSFDNQILDCFFEKKNDAWIKPISKTNEIKFNTFLESHKPYQALDRSVQLAIFVAQSLKNVPEQTAVNIGSSRGATGLWENSYARFRESGTLPIITSPLTTLGNISSWVSQDLGLNGVSFSHSITCATASHAILNAIAWIESGMATSFIAGGSEAPLTDFTISQMQALRIYSRETDSFPCKPLDLSKSQNTMVLGEAAACFLLSKEQTKHTMAKIVGYGIAIEKLSSATSVTTNGQCLQDSMKMALVNTAFEDVDAIITHSPGTIKGDKAEFAAIKEVFGDNHPALCNNKWQLGHTLGASGAMSMAMALEMFEKSTIFEIPYLDSTFTNPRGINKVPQKILINATGFGGNAVSLLLEKF